MAEPRIQLYPDCFYHIYNQTNGSDNFFEWDSDFQYFIDKLKLYILPVAEVYSYCLMNNHFHLLIKIKGEEELKFLIEKSSKNLQDLDDDRLLSDKLSKVFSNLFNAYSKHFNLAHNRKGSLFKRAFQRKRIEDENYLRTLVCYIHCNPIKAGLINHPENWKFSSYKAIVTNGKTLLPRKEIITLFEDVENFKMCHLVGEHAIETFCEDRDQNCVREAKILT